MTIVEFLEARLAEDELTAAAAVEDMLKIICSVYARHPDYDPAWA